MPPTDKLLLRGLRLYGRHGVHAAEKALGQQFIVDVDVHTCLRNAGLSDDFAQTLDYVVAFETARDIVQGEPRHLVERVAEDIAQGVLERLPKAESVRVKVVKPHVALPAVLDSIGVEIVRHRDEELK